MLGGLEAGVLAGVFMLGWLFFDAVRRDITVWTTPNLLATPLLGRSAATSSFGWQTISGLALHLVVSGAHGLLFAAALRPTVRTIWAANTGLLFSLCSFGLMFGWILRAGAPLVYARAYRPAWLMAHLVFGLFLGLYPSFVHRLEHGKTFAAGPETPPPAAKDQAPPGEPAEDPLAPPPPNPG